jgi:integrase
MKDISTERIQAFVSSLKGKGKTVHNIVAVMRSVWRTAKTWGYVSHDPFVGLTLPQVVKADPRCFEVEEAQRIIEHSKEPYKTFYWVAAETGMRAGELCGLRWEDVDVEQGVIHVRQSAYRDVMQAPKTSAGRRAFAVSTRLVAHLLAIKPDRNGLIFLNTLGRPWKPGKVVEKNLYPLLDRLGIPHRGLHALRHLNGSLMDRLGAPVKVRQERLGHSSATMTLDRYTHSIEDDHRRIANQLDSILCPSVSNFSPGESSASAAGVLNQ